MNDKRKEYVKGLMQGNHLGLLNFNFHLLESFILSAIIIIALIVVYWSLNYVWV